MFTLPKDDHMGFDHTWCTTLSWSPETPDLFSAGLQTPLGRCHLLVERLPDGCWDWVVWGPSRHPQCGDRRSNARNAQRVQGAAATAAYGMIAAEHALAMLGVDPIFFGQIPRPGLQAALEAVM